MRSFQRFTITGQSYSVSPDGEFDELDMNISLDNVLMPKITFHHEYDFGTTTSLKIKLLQNYWIIKRVKPVTLLARNEPPYDKM